MFNPRIFKRLDIAKCSTFSYHDFFLERMAYLQWNNNIPFVSGPIICSDNAPDEYSYWSIAQKIDNSLKYYMKPHNISVFGNDIQNTEKSHILSRVWLHSNKDTNNALVLMERIDFKDKYKDISNYNYTVAINNRSWRPLNWLDIEKTKLIHQILVPSDNPYPGSWNVEMKLQV